MDYKKILNDIKFNRMIYTGPIDYFFDFQFGKLPYRSIRFEYKNFNKEYFQPTAQINFVDHSEDFTRVIEHKYLSKQNCKTTTISFEYSSEDGEPFYPVPNAESKELYRKYYERAKRISSVTFVGRLAEYKYYNMDQVVANTLNRYFMIRNEFSSNDHFS
jgi:UDP-galactopyranose mutase